MTHATDPLKLQALTVVAIEEATQRYIDGGSISSWERDMRAVLTRGHTAAYLAGLSERIGVPLDKALISERRLSKAERMEIKEAVGAQLEYFAGFLGDAGDLSDAQIAARSALYAGATRATYLESRWGDWDLPFVPGDGSTECRVNCRCSLTVTDNEDGTGSMVWVLGSEKSCDDCPDRASGSPYTVERKAA